MRAQEKEMLRDFHEMLAAIGESDEAARAVFELCNPYVLRVIRRRLHHRLRRLFDPEDFSQEVWASFFSMPEKCIRFFANQRHLLAFLATIARNKVVEKQRQLLQTQKHDLVREISLSRLHPESQPMDARNSPEQTATVRESWQTVLRNLSVLRRRVLEMLRDEYTHAEIAKSLGVSTKSIQRLLGEMRQWAESA